MNGDYFFQVVLENKVVMMKGRRVLKNMNKVMKRLLTEMIIEEVEKVKRKRKKNWIEIFKKLLNYSGKKLDLTW